MLPLISQMSADEASDRRNEFDRKKELLKPRREVLKAK